MTDELDLFMPPLVHEDPRPAEVAAADVVRPAMGRLAALVLADVVAAGDRGLTGDELCLLHPDLNPYSLRPRLTQLGPGKPRRPGLGLVVPTGERPNRRGNAETVWVWYAYLNRELGL